MTQVTLEDRVTVGNSAVLYPWARLQRGSLLGNDTVLGAGETVAAGVRVQGSLQYVATQQQAANGSATKGGAATAGPNGNPPDLELGGGAANARRERARSGAPGSHATAGSPPSSMGVDEGDGMEHTPSARHPGGSASRRATNGGTAPPTPNKGSRGSDPNPGPQLAWHHTLREVAAMLVFLPGGGIMRWGIFSFLFMLVARLAGWGCIAVYILWVGGGILLECAWMRGVALAVGMNRHWARGRVRITSVPAVIYASEWEWGRLRGGVCTRGAGWWRLIDDAERTERESEVKEMLACCACEECVGEDKLAGGQLPCPFMPSFTVQCPAACTDKAQVRMPLLTHVADVAFEADHTLLLETPFMAMAWRVLGIQVGWHDHATSQMWNCS